MIQDILAADATAQKVQSVPMLKKARQVQFAGWLQEELLTTNQARTEAKQRARNEAKRRRKRHFPSKDSGALGKLATDYGFLSEIVANTAGNNEGSSADHVGLSMAAAKEALAFLEERREFWRQQDPRHCARARGVRELRI